MNKNCPKCGKEIPEEAAFCLNCFSPVGVRVAQKQKNKPSFFLLIRSSVSKIVKNRRFWLSLAGATVFLFVMGICIFVMKTFNSSPALKSPDTTIINVTETVALTESDGEAVTDENGEQVFEIVEITKALTLAPESTEKQGLLDKLFNDKTTENKNTTNTSQTEETTEKKGFWESLFGSDSTTQTETAVSSTQNSVENTQESSTKPSVTETATTPITTEPQTTEPVQTPVTDFEYTLSDKYATIKKYTGNATHVTVPAVIESKYVVRISSNTFQNNDTIETVTFESNSNQPYLWIESQTFNSCSNLRVINFPETDLGIINNFATNCLSVEKLSVTGYQFKYIDGTLYYNTGSTWKLRWHCPAHPTTTITLPNNCSGFESAINLKEARNVKNIYLSKNTMYFPSTNLLPPNCENVYVDDANPYGYDENGIAFQKSGSQYLCSYPPKNTTQSLTLPENSLIYAQHISNPYLKTLYIPGSANIQFEDSILNRSAFSALENLYIGSSHPKADYFLTNSEITNTQKY
ncbi:MAG: leucine-rich repeat protein [Clostridia bacterium]|nr:leucine-rich repeat protein [Clostridia bacterium]